MKSILITGASGFVGSSLTQYLSHKGGYNVSIATRAPIYCGVDEAHLIPCINGETDWSEAVKAKSTVIHCAARVHVLGAASSDSAGLFNETNVQGTLCLARQAAKAGVKRFLFISSIKVNGEATLPGTVFSSESVAAPKDSYGASKYEAERELMKIADETDMEVVIIRPPLVYGPGVKGNFLSLLKLARTGFPLPLGAVGNKRSMIYLENLVDFIVTCSGHPGAANQVFLISDGNDLSTTQLIIGLRKAMHKPMRLLTVPIIFLQMAGKLIGKSAVVDRLCGSLQVDNSKAAEVLAWTPPYSVEQGIQATVADFLEDNK